MAASRVVPLPQPFDFDLTAGHQTYYRGAAGADLYDGGVYYRTLHYGGGALVATARETEGGGALEIGVPGDAGAEALDYAVRAMRRMLGFDTDLQGFYDKLSGDAVLSAAVGHLRGLRPTLTESVFEALVTAVMGQQISGAVARAVREAFVGAFGTPVEAEGRTLYAFPTPETVAAASHEELRAVKLSNRKAEYIHDIALKTLDGTLADERLSALDDDEAIAHMVACRGVGRWTAEWMLMRALGREDMFPAGDLALNRVVSEMYFDGAPLTERELADFGRERWSPHQSLAVTYLFSHLRQTRAAAGRAKSATGDAPL
ncbi:MAG: DNA-3-methyladenine glycosylase [Chloroflexota bacterium]|nr:DNA-3-methyladenine glycosylase [Chloroflexota bacterium]